MRKIVAICGDALVEKGSLKEQFAFETGKLLIDNGYRIQCGGMRGVMEAFFKGAHASEKYKEGDTLAITPGFDRYNANQYADIVVPTGLDLFRNVIVANANAVIVCGGGAGTLSEVANAWALKRLIVAYENIEGWSSKIAGTRIDERIRFEDIPDDKVFAAKSPQEAIDIINQRIEQYSRPGYTGIKL